MGFQIGPSIFKILKQFQSHSGLQNIVLRGHMYPSPVPPMATCYRTIVKYENQDIDILATYRLYSDFTSFICSVCVCVCVCVCV